MDTKERILVIIVSLMILSVFIFQQFIPRLSSIQILATFVLAFIFLISLTSYAIKHKMKKIRLKNIPINKKVFLIRLLPILYFGIVLIFGAMGMDSIAILVGSLGFIVLGSYTFYFLKQWVSEGKMQTLFGYYDQKKNYKAFKLMIVMHIIFGILEIGLGISGLITVL